MSGERRDKIRSVSSWIKPERPSAHRRGHRQWIVRWIGAGRHRADKGGGESVLPGSAASVAHLRWDHTFGKEPSPRTDDGPAPGADVVPMTPRTR